MSDKSKDIEFFFDYGIDVKTKTLYMGSESYDGDDGETGTDFAMAEKVLKGLHILDSLTTSGITIIMNNLGGDFYHGLAIYDAIRACKNQVTIKVFGSAMSMGAVILQAADVRILAPHSTVMIHYGEGGVNGHPKTNRAWVKYEEQWDLWMKNLFLKRIKEKHKHTKAVSIDKKLDFDTILTAEQAIELGLADEILRTHEDD